MVQRSLPVIPVHFLSVMTAQIASMNKPIHILRCILQHPGQWIETIGGIAGLTKLHVVF